MTPALLFYRALTWLLVLLGAPYLIYRQGRHPEEMRERWGGISPEEPSESQGLGTKEVAPARREPSADRPAPGLLDERLFSADDANGPVWVHAASLGEVEAAKAWMEDAPLADGRSWFVTVTSTSARRRAPERLGGEVPVRFAPLDHDFAVGRFLRRYRPCALILLETELWPVTLDRCRRAGIPVYVVSGRITAPAWQKMRHVGRLYWEVASAVRAAAVQAPDDEERFRALLVRNVRVCGNVKYRVPARADSPAAALDSSDSGAGRTVIPPAGSADSDAGPSLRPPAGSADSDAGPSPRLLAGATDFGAPRSDLPTREDRPGRLLWVIGSLRRGEEAVLQAARRVAEAGGAVVLAPRHLRERDFWIDACRRAGLEPVLRSETEGPVPERHEELPSAFFPPDPSADPDASATPEDDIDSVTESGQRFGDRVVDDFVDPVVQSRGRPRLLLVDVHGELRSWYRRASAATVGGTWVRIGGHNLFEPLCEGVPVSFGPYVANVRDVAGAALGEGAAFQCEDPAALVSWVLAQADPANRQKTERSALRAARNLAGAGERTRAFLSEVEASEEWGGIIRPSAQESRAKTGPPSS